MDLGKLLLGNRKKEWKEKDRKLSEKLLISPNLHENLLAVSLQLTNLMEDVRYYYLMFIVQFIVIGLLIFIILMVV